MKIAVMQPYFFPYIGYFQLINAVDKFIFYDDVNFIKNGWINRNRVLINNTVKYLTVQLKEATPFKLINKIEFSDNRPKLKKTIQMAYKKAPMYKDVWPLIEDCLEYDTNSIGDLAIYTIKRTCQYLGVNPQFEISSEDYADTKGLPKADRLKTICFKNDAYTYINPIGGQALYNKDDFKASGISLLFIKPSISEYKQFNDEFIPGLSIIDVMMFNSPNEIKKILNDYDLV